MLGFLRGPPRADLGHASSFVYNEEVGLWTQAAQEVDDAALSPPPPPKAEGTVTPEARANPLLGARLSQGHLGSVSQAFVV